MYSQDVLARVISIAEKFVIDNDRMLYRDIFRVAEEYCADNRLIVGGAIGMDLLTKKPYGKDNFVYDVFCKDSVWKTTCELTDAITAAHVPHLDKSTLKAHTVVKNIESSILINTREIIRVHALPHIRAANIVDLLSPVSIRGYFAEREVLCMSADVHLCDVYRRLYRPYPPQPGYPTYTRLLELESQLYGGYEGAFDDTPPIDTPSGDTAPSDTASGDTASGDTAPSDTASGDTAPSDTAPSDTAPSDTPPHETETSQSDIDEGANGIDMYIEGSDVYTEDTNAEDTNAEDTNAEDTNAENGYVGNGYAKNGNGWRQSIDDTIINNVLRGSLYVLIGDYAIESNTGTKRLQFISDGDIPSIVSHIESAVKAERINARFETPVKYALQLPNDFQTVKYTVYAIDPNGKRVSLVDIFNSASFELIPFGVSKKGPLANVRVAGVFVLLRFKMIDLYVLKFISALSKKSDDPRSRDIKRQILSLRSGALRRVSEDPESVFQLDDYYGKYLDERFQKKLLEIQLRTHMLPDYYPLKNNS